ncbi:MAG: hypothetical protein FWC09_09835 [Lachnospiraceae bacterium]|nr:hypothetical protein [Lachnospiraceae bacterium]
MKKLIIGIDGGGTKSHMAVFNESGKCLTVGKCGSLNHENMEGSFTELKGKLSDFIKETLANIGAIPQDVSYAVLGIAGVDTAKQHELVSEFVKDIGLPEFLLCNDAFLGVPAGCPDGVGICAINGTGSSIAAIDLNGETIQVGGIRYLSNDCGGGAWFGEKLLGCVYGELFKSEKETVMTKYLFAELKISDPAKYVETVTARIEEETLKLGSHLNNFVFKAAGEGDEMAIRILNESAGHYAGGIIYMAKTYDFPTDKALNIILAGSVFVKEKVRILPNLIAEKVAAQLPGRKLSFKSLEVYPVVGAINSAARKAGIELSISEISAEITAAGL